MDVSSSRRLRSVLLPLLARLVATAMPQCQHLVTTQWR
jgi:hypothetical protein